MSTELHPVGSSDRHVFLCWNGVAFVSGQNLHGAYHRHMGYWHRKTVRQTGLHHTTAGECFCFKKSNASNVLVQLYTGLFMWRKTNGS